MARELLIQVDDEDNVVGPVERLNAHSGSGILHRGLMALIKNSDNEVLLTQRSIDRPDLSFPPPFPGFWDITLAGHPKWGQNDYVTQMADEVREELGIRSKAVEYVGKFEYSVADPSYPNPNTQPTFKLSEREMCGVGVFWTDETPSLNPAELQGSRWIDSNALPDTLKMLRVAPWALIMIEKFPQLTKD